MEYQCAVFAALSDPIRLRCLGLIVEQGELCVCELTHALQSSQPKISKHLAVLRDAGLVRDRRDAQWVLYAIASDLPAWMARTVEAAVQGIADAPLHVDDRRRLAAMTSRPPRQRVA